jgi:hypothetical protein
LGYDSLVGKISIEDIILGAQSLIGIIAPDLDPEKPSFRPSKWLEVQDPKKLLKIVNYQNC